MKIKKRTRIIGIVALIAAAATMVLAKAHMPDPEAAPFWTYISETDPYTQWDMWPGKEGVYEGQSPHGAYLKLYINDTALNALKENKPMPDGAIIVKENYGKDKEQLMAVTPMYRKKGYNPDAGDWFWAKYGPQGKVMTAGKVKGCIDCHRAQETWLFTETSE
ncbi:MAG: cytochrome P460 family protein [Desulfotignum sp.]